MLLLNIFFITDFSKGRRKISFGHWWSGYGIVFSKSSLSFQFPSSTQIAGVSLAYSERCLCSKSLVHVTLYPLPVQPRLIIIPVFQVSLFPGGMYKNFQIHIPIRQSDSGDGFFNNGYSRQERNKRQISCWQQSSHSIFRWLLRRPDHSYIHNSDWGIWHCLGVWDTRAPRLSEICWPLSWFSASEANQIALLVSEGL